MKKILCVFVLMVSFSALCFSQTPRPAAAKPSVTMQLPQPQTNSRFSLEQAIENRRSIRQFTEEPLTIAQLGQICWAAQGITEPNKGMRTAPSAGAIYPIELYVVLPDGLYLYRPATHDLSKLITGDLRKSVSNASFNQRFVQTAPCTFIIAGSIKKVEARYRNRGAKFTYIEAGHIAQNIQLQSTVLGLGSVPIGVIDEKTIAQICKLPQGLEVLYIVPVGNPTEKPVLTPAASSAPAPVVVYPSAQADLRAKRVAIIIPSRYFKDSDYYAVEQALTREGVQKVIAGTVLNEVRGIEVRGTRKNILKPTVLVRDLKIDEYDAFVFIGGTAIGGNFNNQDLINLARSAFQADKILAAISDAPVIFAYADIVRGKNVTAALSERHRLVNAGANWQKSLLVTDGNLITAGDSASVVSDIASRFAVELIAQLRKQRTAN
ncbi:MAG: hypothetical protein A2Y10_07125 [Planctomycetes bacterium GWF2_41_51]|nr:MAG: hypothetical protein A2Y10_07125 [Planctomycetes bacterium GWF2_41_51]